MLSTEGIIKIVVLTLILFVLLSPGFILSVPPPKLDVKNDAGQIEKKPVWFFSKTVTYSSEFVHAIIFALILFAILYFVPWFSQ